LRALPNVHPDDNYRMTQITQPLRDIVSRPELWPNQSMIDGDDDPIRRRMRSLSDEELRRVMTVDAADWRPEVVDIARQELERREHPNGVDPFRAPSPPRGPQEAPLADKRRPNVPKGAPLVLLLLVLARVLMFLMR